MFKSLRAEESQECAEYPRGGWNFLIQGTETVTHVANLESLVTGATRCTAKFKIHVYYWHRASDIIKDVRAKFETSDTRLLDALSDVNTERRNDVRQKYSKFYTHQTQQV